MLDGYSLLLIMCGSFQRQVGVSFNGTEQYGVERNPAQWGTTVKETEGRGTNY